MRRNKRDDTLALVGFAQVAAFTSAGFLHRKGLQYHWRNRDRSSNNINNNNGAEKSDATSNAVSNDSVGVLSTATPAGTVQQAVVVGERGGAGGDKKMYRDFDAYLGNFASKRRIKVCKKNRANAALERGGGITLVTPDLRMRMQFEGQ